MPISVLVVDDEELLAQSCAQILTGEGYRVRVEHRGEAAVEAVRREAADVVLTDLKLPDIDGLALLRQIREISPSTLVVVITGFATVNSSIEALAAGAYDYIPKPFTATQLRILMGRAAQQVELSRANRELRGELMRRYGASGIVGESEPIQKVLQVISKVAPTDANVFISGESGTGKELIARAVHTSSRRADRPFIAINCAALPEHLLESELFGHERGAFTGAEGARAGLVEAASGGTFFLDEISEMSLDLQAKLLRVVQERVLRRVGGSTEVGVDVRWVTATNRDPEAAVRDGRLRQDLYFRLNVVPIRVSPLRERTEDIPLLVQHFLREVAQQHGRRTVTIRPAVLKALCAHDWPGNVRELRNIVERMVSLSATDEIGIEDIPEELLHGEDGGGGASAENAGPSSISGWRSLAGMPFHDAKGKVVEQFERFYLETILRESRGNISEAARRARIDRKTIHRLLGKHGMDDRDG